MNLHCAFYFIFLSSHSPLYVSLLPTLHGSFCKCAYNKKSEAGFVVWFAVWLFFLLNQRRNYNMLGCFFFFFFISLLVRHQNVLQSSPQFVQWFWRNGKLLLLFKQIFVKRNQTCFQSSADCLVICSHWSVKGYFFHKIS